MAFVYPAWLRLVRRSRPLLEAAALLAAAPTNSALAGPPEWLSRAVIDRTDPNTVVLAYQNRWGGLLFSDDGGKTFAMRCMYSMDTGTIKKRWNDGDADPLFALSADGKVLVPTYRGLSSGDLRGCGFTGTPGNPGWIVDAMTGSPRDGGVFYLHMSPNPYEDASRSCERRGLWRRNADGSFTELGANTTLEVTSDGQSYCVASTGVNSMAAVASGDRVRLYELGLRNTAMPSDTVTVVIRYSEDEGRTFPVEHVLPAELSALPVSPEVLLTNPSDPDELILRFDLRDQGDRLFITRDAGANFSELLPGQISAVSNALVAADGRVWLADRGDSARADRPKGLWVAPSFGAEFTRVQETTPIFCLAESPAGLWGCTLYGFGPLDPTSGEVDEIWNIKKTAAYVRCDGEDLTALCKDQLCDPFQGESWCGARHHAAAPICDQFNSVQPCCGWPARDYDFRAESDMPVDGTCRAVPPYYVDAGGPTGAPGDAGESGLDAGLPADAGATGGGGTDGLDGGPSGSSKRGGGGGCSVSQPAAPDARGVAWSALFGLIAGWVARRRGRRAAQA